MSTIFNVRNMKLPGVSRTAVIIGTLLVVLALVAGVAGWQLYKKLTFNTVVAYFPEALALYPGDKVQIMGVRVGAIDDIEPEGDRMKVTFSYENKYKVPADATASILNPSLVASRTIQLSPAYSGGPELENNAVIPIERTQVPVEWDDLRNQITDIVSQLGPTPEQPKGPFGDVIESFADGLAGKGEQINTTLNALSDSITALNQGRGDFFAVAKSLALFVNALHQSDQQFVELNDNLAAFTDSFTNSDQELATALRDIDGLLTTTQQFIDDNGSELSTSINNLAATTNAILQPEPRDGLETALHVFPNLAANLVNIYEPTSGSLSAIPVVASFANPMQFICSSIQAGSRLGYQESAELCAQYLAPVMDAMKFNFPPFGVNQFSTAVTLPKYVAYSEPRLQPPPGYKDTTVPGVWSRDTLFSHGNHEPGWIVAPGMQGLQVQQFTKNMLTPDSLAALMGGPDPASVPPAGPRGGAPPNSYDQNNPLPPPWYPQPPPPPVPAPGVIPGPLPLSQQVPGPAPAATQPAPAGPPLPAEVGGPVMRMWTLTGRAAWRTLVLAVITVVLASCGWRGVANVPLPGGPGTSGDKMTVYVQMPDTLALNVNSRVRVADVFVGSVRKIELVNWVATLTLDIDPKVQLPENATARIGQTSLLGTQHVELAAPEDPAAQPLRSGDTIPLENATSYPTTERTLASIATVLRGGGIPNLEVIQTEVNNILDGNAEQVRAFLGKLDVFTEQLNLQREDLTRAIDSTNELLTIVAGRNDTLDRVLTEFPPLIQYFADQRDLFADAVIALGRFSKATGDNLSAARADLETDLALLQRPLKQLGRGSPYLAPALQFMLTTPFTINHVPTFVRGDYINISANIDLTLSTLDNAFLTGTGFSGALRALEQAWGRDPSQMIPDVRFTPDPNSVPGGPLVERGE